MKRFIDDQLWSDVWFQELDTIEKLFWIYLFTNCSRIGIWEENTKKAEFEIGKKINWNSIKEKFSDKVLINGKVWIIKKFLEIQYPSLLQKTNSPLHISVFKELEKKCLKLNGNSLSIDYPYPIDRSQVKDKVRVMVKVMVVLDIATETYLIIADRNPNDRFLKLREEYVERKLQPEYTSNLVDLSKYQEIVDRFDQKKLEDGFYHLTVDDLSTIKADTLTMDDIVDWRSSFETYAKIVNEAHEELVVDIDEIKKQEELNPGVDVKLSIEKAVHNFWGKEAGWKWKKQKTRDREIDMKATLINAIDKNKVWKPKTTSGRAVYEYERDAASKYENL